MTTRFMTMIALERTEFADVREVIAALKATSPDLRAEALGAAPNSTEASVAPNLIRIGGTVFALMLIDKPLPADVLERPLAYNRGWPEAGQVLGGQKAHIVAAVFKSEEGFVGVRQSAMDLTHLTAALCRSHPVLGVVWTEANTLVPPAKVLEAAQLLTSGQFPLDLWLQIHPYPPPSIPETEQVLGFATEGLAGFIGREIEFQPTHLPPQETAMRVVNIAQYLLAQGAVLADGHTLGLTETEKVRVRHRSEAARPGLPILELTLEQEDPKPAPLPGLGGTPMSPQPAPGNQPKRPAFGKRGRV